jgi:hypothetical protein
MRSLQRDGVTVSRRRMSRVPWNFGGGPVMFRRLPPYRHMRV